MLILFFILLALLHMMLRLLHPACRTRGLGALFITDFHCYSMDHNMGEESSEMYWPDEQGKYGTAMQASSFTIQGLSDALMTLDPQVTEVTEVPLPEVEYALQLEVTMADQLGWPQPPPVSWNAGMVMHVLKGDPALQDLEHIQMDGPSTSYLFFYNKQGRRGLVLEAIHALRVHVGDAFSEWISQSAHFVVNPIPLVEGWHCAMATAEW